MKNILSDLRQDQGFTQQELANCVGTSRQTIISIERGRYDPGLALAIRLARVFERSVEDVFLLDE